MSGSVGDAFSCTVPLRMLDGSLAVPAGAVVSIETCAVFGDSTLPATSVER